MRIIDVHCHYEDEAFAEDLEELLVILKNKGVEKIINAGAGIESSKGAIKNAKNYNNIYCTIGIHPEFVDKGDSIEQLKELYFENKYTNKIVAIGEIGLDYHYTNELKAEQKKLFKEQLEFAYEVGLPVQIHSREASLDTIEVLESTDKKPEKIMFHCFDLNEQTARYIIKKGYKISVGGNITYKRTETAIKVLREMPIENIMTETDAPYLAPQSLRRTRNESSNIKEIIYKLAEIKEIDAEELSEKLYNNAIEFYNFKK